MPTDRRVAAAVAVIGAIAFVTLAALLVPWNPVPGGGPTSLPSPESVLPRAQLDRAEAYAGPARWLGWASYAVSMTVVCWLGFTAAGRRLVGRLRGWWWVRVLLGVALVSLVGRLATLPFAVVSYRRRVSYGLSTQAWPDWLRDVAVSWAVNVVASTLVLMVVVGTARRWRTWWPAIAGGIAAVLVMVGSFVYPVLVEPLFNSFTPLADGPLRTGVFELAKAEGVHVDDVLEADASRRTTTLNAYVSGFGGTRRVVLYDNLVRDVPEDQVLSVVAHELGHARHDDVLTGSLLGAAGSVMGIGLLGLVLGRRRTRVPAPGNARNRRCSGGGATGTRPGGGGGAARQPDPERDQPADRDPRRCRRGAGHEGPRGVRRGPAAAGEPLTGRPDGPRLVAVLVRQPPDDA